jgi:translocation and assembly module TamA
MSEHSITFTLRALNRPFVQLAPAFLLGALLGAEPARAEVLLTGLDDAQSANVLAYIEFDDEPCDAPAWRVEQQFQASPARIRDALQALGYYEPRIEPKIERDDACWHATFTVELGQPVVVRAFDVLLDGEAAGDNSFITVRDESPLRAGATLHHGQYETLKRRWSDLALERGYADAKFTESRIDVYPEQRAADVVLHFDSGKRYRFGDVAFDQDVLSDRLIRSYLTFHPGDPYDARELTDLYISLADSGYFRNIEVRPAVANRDTGEIPIGIVLTGASRRLITYGVGYSTDTGPRIRFGRNNRRFNDRGHQFGVNAQLSPVISEVTANYRYPYGDPRTEWMDFDVGIKSEDTDTAQSESLELGARRVLERPGDWTRTQMLNLLVEDFEVADQLGRARLLMPGINWTRIRADNNIRPSRGSKLELDVRGANDVLGSDTDFLQVVAKGKWIWSLSPKARILVRGDLGATEERSFDELPPSVRFFAGGDNSVRGYDFEALGPVDADGEVIGGLSLAVGSFEYEHSVRPRWSVAVFVDSGNAFEGSNFDAKTGAGLGARWQSPLGPIRVDLAHPLDDPDTSWRLHISLGPDL